VTVNLGLSTAQNTVGAGVDTIKSIENFGGSTYNDTITGDGGNNYIDAIVGNDIIDGGLGNDYLIGGSGLDIFIFDTALNATTNIDTIADFTAVDDTIQLSKAIFTVLTATGTLSASYFLANSTGTAGDSNDYILYNTTTGALYYDADGSGSGAAVEFAVLGTSTHPAITNADFIVA
jgi:Ca2+-binding RTX toxin-like protein